MADICKLTKNDVAEYLYDINYKISDSLGCFTFLRLKDGQYAIEHRHPFLGTYFCEYGPYCIISKKFHKIAKDYHSDIVPNINKVIDDVAHRQHFTTGSKI